MGRETVPPTFPLGTLYYKSAKSCFFDKVFRSNRKVRQVGAEHAKKGAHLAAFAPSLSALRLWFDCGVPALCALGRILCPLRGAVKCPICSR